MEYFIYLFKIIIGYNHVELFAIELFDLLLHSTLYLLVKSIA